ncbi:ImmA/IrrE family metallo-endopeptidase [Peribacillus frigoritolerans]|uniref:ImmA/IrrE family metallo-endopeptidase n=1 Tax=Peribacillus frigoritolerans TaxID=450367 RepID=UPI001F4FE644|nr:ImmA/IrrE family metallo-endopeptidase [Peribacillus frigoritolerans]MCK2017962.1 ImmA/IrrE family metallo-endopeptidase [Peribacillus frigoritolerans]
MDNNFTLNNFGHLIDVKNVPIKNLILSSRDEALYNVVQKVLEDSIAQYHFNQEIQRIIKNNHPEELDALEYFINKCSCDKQENVLEFICDLFELTSIQHFLNSRWKIDLTERIYKNFSRNQNLMSPIAKRNALTAVNRFKSRLAPNFSLVARHEISRLSENDKNFIIKKVGKISEEIIGEFINTLVPVEKKWDWKEYAYFLVKWYKDLNPLEDAINVVKLGKDLGIKIIVKEFETENFDACLVRDKTLKSPIVFINSFKKSRGRINFSIAHELAHAILPHHAQSTFFCFLDDVTESNKFVMNRKLENEANAFASYVLLPDKIFKEEISKLNYTIKNVNTLSKKYNSSLVLVAKKWVEQSNLEIAMIFSTNGVIDWATTSENFPFSWVDYIASTSTVFKVIESQERKIKKQRVSSTNWFNKDYPIYKIHEESYKIFDDKVLTLLQIIEDN